MNFTVINVQQGSDEWKAARSGRATGSRAKDILAKIKTGEAAARRDYRTELLIERLTGLPSADGFVSADMKWGTEQEPYARMAYEAHTGLIVRETGFLQATDLMVGASVDGDVDGFAGIVEFKCPKSATHWNWLKAGVVPPEHIPQVTFNLWVSGAQWCDFATYDPRFPPHLQLMIRRVHRKDVDIAGVEREVLAFLAELERELEQAASMSPVASIIDDRLVELQA